MKIESRTSKSIHNIKIAFLFFFINLLLQFFSRKIFLDYLGSEVLGLNTTAQNLLGFLNLAELGIGGAVAYNLYKPLYEKNFSAIIDIVSIQGWLYRRIAYVIIGGSSILMCFFPLIFSKAEVPVWYTYGTFIVLLLSSLLSYFVNYKQIVLSADQKQYKITQNVQGCKIIKIIFQIIAIKTLPNGYVWWLIIETIMAIITSICLTQTIKHEYSWLHTKIQEGRKLNVLYPNIMKKTKQSFFHNIGTFILAQTSPLIIYAYSSLTLVAIYGNYLIIVKGIESLMSALLNGINAGIGNLIAEGNKKNIKHFFLGNYLITHVVSFHYMFWSLYVRGLIYYIMDRSSISVNSYSLYSSHYNYIYRTYPYQRLFYSSLRNVSRYMGTDCRSNPKFRMLHHSWIFLWLRRYPMWSSH